MTVRVVISRTADGVVSAVGFVTEGLPFVCHLPVLRDPADVRTHAVRELRFLLEYLRSAGVVVENLKELDDVFNDTFRQVERDALRDTDSVSDVVASVLNAYMNHFRSPAVRDEVHRQIMQAIRSLVPKDTP